MNKFEQQIENAALQLIGGPIDEQSCMEHDEKLIYFNFKKGAKSDASKEFWQQGTYSEGEVHVLIGKAILATRKDDWNIMNNNAKSELDIETWFEQNKKK